MACLSRSRRIPLVLSFLAVCWASGCGPVSNRVPVEGVVTLDGAPVEGASISFIPTAGGRPGVAGTDAAGRFVIREAGMKTGLPPGDYDVAIFKAVMAPLVPTASTIAPPATGDALLPVDTPPPMQVARWIVPERYSTPKANGLSTTISGATKNLVFSLTTRE